MSGRARLALREFGEAVRLGDIGAHQVEQLHAQAERWRQLYGLPASPLELTRRGGSWSVRARYLTGFASVAGLHLEILPKFLPEDAREGGTWRRALWRILLLAGDDVLLDEPTEAVRDSDAPLADLLAEAFLRSVSLGAARGLPRGYVERETTEPVLLGRLDESRWAELVTEPWSLPCVVDTLDEDIPINRLLRWAARHLAADVSSPARARALAEWADTLAGVGVVPPRLEEARRLAHGPQHRALAPAVEIARLLLQSRGEAHGPGQAELQGFLWVTERVFEALVRRVCAQAARRLGLRTVKSSVPLGLPARGQALRTTPDVRLLRGGRTVMVLDAKYKVEGRPTTADAYQVIAGGKVLDCDEVALVWPVQPGGTEDEHEWAVPGAGRPSRLSTLAVDLSRLAEPAGEQALCGRMEEFLRARLSAPVPR